MHGGFLTIQSPGLHPEGNGRSDRTQRRFIARRRKKPGYPWDGKFTTNEELEAYFSGDRIICLQCGRYFRKIGGAHLERLHNMTPDDYRAKYSIPWRKGLVSDESAGAYSAAVKTRLQDEEKLQRLREIASAARPLIDASKQRKRVKATMAMMIERIAGKQVGAIWGKDDAEEILRRVATGRTLQDVFEDEGLPKQSWWHFWCRQNPEYRTRLAEIIEAQPFHLQSRADALGARFRAEIARLRTDGLSDKRIAEILGVTAMAVNRTRRKMGLPNLTLPQPRPPTASSD